MGRLGLMASGALLVALGATGCSVSVGGLDVAKIQDQIGANLKEAAGSETVSVSCPSDVQRSAGATFDCTAKVGDQTVTYTVTQTDGDGNVTYAAQQALLDLDTIEQTVQTQLAEQISGDWTVSCDGKGSSRILAEAPGATFECDAVGGQQEATITVTVKDVEGNISWTAR